MGKNALFDDYDAFVKKFEPKKTTDDCYTPPKVYEAVLAWARQRVRGAQAMLAVLRYVAAMGGGAAVVKLLAAP